MACLSRLDIRVPGKPYFPGSYFTISIWGRLANVPVCATVQDRPDDEKAGVKSLAVFLGDGLKSGLAVLGVAQVAFFIMAAAEASVTNFMWVFGIAAWTASVPWSIISLDPRDRDSGGRIFRFNAVLILYLTAVSAVDVYISGQ